MPILEAVSRWPSPVTHILYIMEDRVRTETEAFCWHSSAISVPLKSEVLVRILFPLKFHQINHSSKEADTHLHTTRNRLVPDDGTLCPVVTPGIQLGLHQLFQAGKTTTPSHALPLTAPILHSSQYPCPLPHDCHFSMQIRISLPCDNGLDYVTCFDQQDINR